MDALEIGGSASIYKWRIFFLKIYTFRYPINRGAGSVAAQSVGVLISGYVSPLLATSLLGRENKQELRK